MNNKLYWVISVGIDNGWVSDGFEFTKDNLTNKIQTLLPFATSNEIDAKIIKFPSRKIINKLQGYKK